LNGKPTLEELLEIQQHFGLPTPAFVEKDWHVVIPLSPFVETAGPAGPLPACHTFAASPQAPRLTFPQATCDSVLGVRSSGGQIALYCYTQRRFCAGLACSSGQADGLQTRCADGMERVPGGGPRYCVRDALLGRTSGCT
jgi:hypothetical protein